MKKLTIQSGISDTINIGYCNNDGELERTTNGGGSTVIEVKDNTLVCICGMLSFDEYNPSVNGCVYENIQTVDGSNTRGWTIKPVENECSFSFV